LNIARVEGKGKETRVSVKKILFIKSASLSAKGGGVEGQILRTARELSKRTCLVPVLATNSSDSELACSFRKSGFAVLTVPMTWRTLGDAAKRLSMMVGQDSVAVVQSHLFFDSLIARLMRKRRVDIRHVFRAETYIGGLPIPSWKKVTCYAVERCASKYVDRYVVNGAYLRREVVNRARVKANKIVVLHNGVEGLGPADDACGIPEMPMSSHLAMIANFLPGKGHDVLIRGIAILRDRGFRVNARLIGGGVRSGVTPAACDTRREIEVLAEGFGVLDNIEFYGHTNDIYTALRGCPIVVLPSDSEGIPNCILEAMSIGKVVIGSQNVYENRPSFR
jgi:glycosyltransferase involved in cell wall biosynthesis